MVTRWRHCGDYVRTYLRDLRLSFSNCVSGASHSYDIKAKSKDKNFNTDQGHQVKTNNWKKTSETLSTANNNRRGRSQCKVRGWISKSQIATYKQRWRCIGCTKSKKAISNQRPGHGKTSHSRFCCEHTWPVTGSTTNLKINV